MKLSTWSTTKIYIGSVLLSPFSIYWFFKYYKDPLNKTVAYVSLIISVVAFVAGLYVAKAYVDAVKNYTDAYSGLL